MAGQPKPLLKLREVSPMYVHLPKPFIDTSAKRLASPERVFEQCKVATCPASRRGTLLSLFDDVEEEGEWADVERRVSTCPSSRTGLLQNLFKDEQAGLSQPPMLLAPQLETMRGVACARSSSGGSTTSGASSGGVNGLVPSSGPGTPPMSKLPSLGPVTASASILDQVLTPVSPPALVLSLATALGQSMPRLNGYTMPGSAYSVTELPTPFATAATEAWTTGLRLLDGPPGLERPSPVDQNPNHSPGLEMPSPAPEVQEEPEAESGPEDLPSVGSKGHAVGRCKPCAFFHTTGCTNGLSCEFCHLCEEGERKRRRKEKLEMRRAAHKMRRAAKPA